MSTIQGNKFKSIADFCYAPPNSVPRKDYNYLVSTLDRRDLRNGHIIYTHSFYARQLFALNLKQKYILITHNSDLNIDFAPPENIIMWYSQNVNIEHPRIKSIPIGLENDCWYPEKKRRMVEIQRQKKIFRNLVYMNHNIGTNPKRKIPYDVLKGKKWVTSENGKNGQGIGNYIDNIYNHPFVICPAGHGMDTHRMWECLYLRTIPVVIRDINNQFYKDLPICFIDDWNDLTEEFLFSEYKRMAEVKWNLEKLNFEYWRNEIRGYN